MVVLEREEYFNRLNTFLGDTNTDESVQFLEDMTDTYNDMSSRLDGGGVDWKRKYEENNEAWKKRYTERFFAGGTNNPNERKLTPIDDDDDGYNPDNVQVANLFTKKEAK